MRLECATNFRDLGGWRVAHGGIFRSERGHPAADSAAAAALAAHAIYATRATRRV